MNYPIWDLPNIGGGTLIAIIAILHVYISHLAVGGGLFLWITDLLSVKKSDKLLKNYVNTHTWFFLLVTMVFGGMTGVGIWFIIALVHPAATSVLIHNFVFGWAIEWVFFVGEIIALLIYHYRFEKMNDKDRLMVAFFYFLFAWLSMVVINGILAFMLTPGKWISTHNFWDGFFNPTYFSSLMFRTCMAIIIAGIFALVTALRSTDNVFRLRMMRYSSKWLLFPLLPFALSSVWYFLSLPDEIRFRSFALNPQTHPLVIVFLVASTVIFITGILLSFRAPRWLQLIITVIVLIMGLGWIGAFEYMREVARKPYVLGNYLYSTSIFKDSVAILNTEGVLKHSRWSEIHSIDSTNAINAGHELFRIQCLSCHTVNGIRNNICPQIKNYTYLGILSNLSGEGKIVDYMPPFVGTSAEKEALALYLTKEINKKEIVLEPASFNVLTLRDSIPTFDNKKDEFVLLAWNDLGMHCISDNEQYFSFLPPANTLESQLIQRGNPPRLITADSVEVNYQVEKGFENPSRYVDFWKYSKPIFGNQLIENVGLFGKGLSGTFNVELEKRSYVASAVPVVPYNDDGTYNPYPTFTITAKNKNTGRVLMATRMVGPVSTEMGCRNCHEGPWRTESKSGVSAQTAENFLMIHDRLNKTTLLSDAKSGSPRLCQGCHSDPALGAKGKSGILNFSSAMHGWHANYLQYNDSRACQMCHPAFMRGNTRCLRDLHARKNIGCTQCHGSMAEHAAGLLNGQSDIPSAEKLIAYLDVKDSKAIHPRTPWMNEPDCKGCHVNFDKPVENASSFNQWNSDFCKLYRNRSFTNGVRCIACHGSTHAVYPAFNGFGRDRDNMQPLQYGGMRGPLGMGKSCVICHTKEPTDKDHHHENCYREFRDRELLK
jgi:hypothetical protein